MKQRDRVYISGPMTGYKDYNRPAFRAMASKLRAAGYETLNPADVLITEGTWSDYMRVDLQMLVVADLMVVLPGWHESRGARLEVTIAHQLGIPIYCCPGEALEPIAVTSAVTLTCAGVAV